MANVFIAYSAIKNIVNYWIKTLVWMRKMTFSWHDPLRNHSSQFYLYLSTTKLDALQI